TTTSFTASLACLYQQIKVAHIEAGLRTHNIYSPWPEEANRQLTARLAKLHFAPTQASKQNLVSENIDSESVIVTGNTVIDALYWVLNKIETEPLVKGQILSELAKSGFSLTNTKKLILVTGHRRENFGHGFINICEALKEIADSRPDVEIVYPVHLNPNVGTPVKQILSGTANVHLIDPLSYLPFVFLMSQAHLIITDSGGVQEEAPSLGKPVLVTRNTTERPEAVTAGTVKLVGTIKEKIVAQTLELLNNDLSYQAMSQAHNPYGDGNASSKIVAYLRSSAAC
ncbi:MAG TPA: UDP-N-acetylglucosamine 2-epimerase (non-hydrolyzing), partial [Candidatus Rifleibacterium sp.]|nr:UDP-N-acetylglucosamine 2-epimerase (non-hydrolyzing) [Candidatus Rifleibacterium sp.]